MCYVHSPKRARVIDRSARAVLAALATVLAVGPADAQAREKWSGFVAAGPGVAPSYLGSGEYELIPFVAGEARRGRFSADVQGLQLRAGYEVAPRVRLGPVVNVRLAREEAEDARARLLADVPTAVEVGAFAAVRIIGNDSDPGGLDLSVQVTKDVADAHDGVTGAVQVAYTLSKGGRWFASLDAQVEFGDEKFTGRYFGVAAPEAARSRLSVFRPDGGLVGAGAGATLGYGMTRRLGLIARLGYTRLTGKTKDSPIFESGGSSNQWLGGIALRYSFGG